jgi:hypothetical protein
MAARAGRNDRITSVTGFFRVGCKPPLGANCGLMQQHYEHGKEYRPIRFLGGQRVRRRVDLAIELL